jgi:hypothetical protein
VTFKTDTKDLRNFGLIVGGVFALIGCWPLVVYGRELRLWALALAALFILPALAFPAVLKPVHKRWMIVGHWLGWINTRILLGILFYGVVTPMGLLRRLWVKDALTLQFRKQADTYRCPREPRPGAHMRHPF